MKGPVWTEEEIAILKEYYAREGTAIVARLPGRSVNGVKGIAQNLGLYCRHEINSWTEEEVAIIKKYYPVEGKKCISRLPMRTVSTLQTMANKLGVHKNKRK